MITLKSLKTKENGFYGKTALSQLEEKGLANVVGDKIYYWNEYDNVFVMCGSSTDYHNAVISVLQKLGYDVE